jgi:hypothetical protein
MRNFLKVKMVIFSRQLEAKIRSVDSEKEETNFNVGENNA